MSVQVTELKGQSSLLTFSNSDGGIDELIRTNRELHAVVLELKDLLANPARHASYHGIPQVVSSTGSLGCTGSSLGPSPRKKTPRTLSETKASVGTADDLVPYAPRPKLGFTEENEAARQRHEQRRTSEMLRLKHWIDYKYISFPPAFYQREIEAYERSERLNVIDPFHWWTRLQKHLPHHHDRISTDRSTVKRP